MRRVGYWFFVCRGLSVSSASLMLLVSHGRSSASTPSASDVISARREQSSKVVAVTLVGVPYEAEAMVTLIRELLERQGVTVQSTQQSSLTESDLLAVSSSSALPPTRIWIHVPDLHRAVLYFGQPEHNRYLFREIPLRSGLDELGREEVAQVVKVAALALLEGAPALTREVFQTEIDEASLVSGTKETEPPTWQPDGSLPPGFASTLAPADPRPATSAFANPKTEPSRERPNRPHASDPPQTSAPTDPNPYGAPNQPPNPTRSGPPGRGVLRVTPQFSLGYSLQWSGPELNAQHGPSLRAGIRLQPKKLESHGMAWPILLAWEPRLTQTYRGQRVDLDTTSQFAWLLAGSRYAFNELWALQALLGAGCEFVHIVTRPSSESVAVTSGDNNRRIPWVRLELGGAVRSGAFALGASAVLDVSLFAARYEVQSEGTTEHLFSPWLLRPGIRLGADFSW